MTALVGGRTCLKTVESAQESNRADADGNLVESQRAVESQCQSGTDHINCPFPKQRSPTLSGEVFTESSVYSEA